MLTNLKALVVVLALAFVVFRVARPLCLQYMSADAFARRRNVWFALTVVAFVTPTFWAYGLFALVLLGWAAVHDENPLALYVLVTFTVPNASFYIPTFLVNQLFDLTQYRILSLVVIIPAMVRSWNGSLASSGGKLKAADWFLLAFLLLQLTVQFPYESITASMRRGFLLTIDTFVVFYAFSRLATKQSVADVVASFWVACALMAPIAIFEWAKGWHLYTGLSSQWGDPNIFAYLLRGGGLRSQAAANHSLNLGYLLAVCLGFFLYLKHRSQRGLFDWLVIAVFSAALFSTGSRAAWIMGVLVVLLFATFRPGAAQKLAQAAAIGVFVVGLMYVTPLKESVIDRLPIVGKSDQDTVDYRQQLYDVSMPLIRQNPLFGDPFVARNMESLRQGQGIIDIVNGYLFTALFYGLVGLFLQMAALLTPLWKAFRSMYRARAGNHDTGLLGAGLVSSFIGSLFFIATAGFGPTTYCLAGLLLSYALCAAREPSGIASIQPSSPRMRARNFA